MIGAVYMVRQGSRGLIKIGWTSNPPEERLVSLQTGNGIQLKLIAVIPDAPVSLEREWHDKFSDFRCVGEGTADGSRTPFTSATGRRRAVNPSPVRAPAPHSGGARRG